MANLLAKALLGSVLLAAALAAPAAAQSFPPLTGRVVDAADIVPPDEEAALTALLEAHEGKTTNQVVVATVPDLGGRDIAEYGIELGRAWGIGQKDNNNGVILLVAPSERAVTIQVGYGLEGELTDALSKLIIEGSVLPRFRANDYPGGIRRGVEDITAVLEGDAAAFRERAAERVKAEDTAFSGASVFLFMLIMFILVQFFGGGRRRRSRGRWGPVIGGGFGGGFGSGSSGGGFSGGGGSFGGGGASGRW